MKVHLLGKMRRPHSPYTYVFIMEDEWWIHFRREKRSGATEPWRMMTHADVPAFAAALSTEGWRLEMIEEEITVEENYLSPPVYK